MDLCFLPGLQRIKDDHILCLIERLIRQTDQVCTDLAGLAVIDPVDGLVTRVGDLFRVFRKLDLRDKITGLCILNSSQLVYAAESRAVLTGDEVGTDTPGSDLCTLSLQAVEKVFRQRPELPKFWNYSLHKGGR